MLGSRGEAVIRRELCVGTLDVRALINEPPGIASMKPSSRPLVIRVHADGHICRFVCRGLQLLVVSLVYKLTPEHVFAGCVW